MAHAARNSLLLFLITLSVIISLSSVNVSNQRLSGFLQNFVEADYSAFVSSTPKVFNGTTILTTPGPFPSQKDICDQLSQAKRDNKHVALIRVVNNDPRFCLKFAAGNKLLSMYSVQALAYNQNSPFEIDPPCTKESSSIIAWLPQNISLEEINQIDTRTKSEIHQNLDRLCLSPADPLPTSRDDNSWIHYSPIWRQQFQRALTSWAIQNEKEEIPNNTAAIHVRCGDILTAKKIQYGFQPLSFYTKHLRGRNVSHIDILTPSLKLCSDSKEPQNNGNTRPVDCWNADKCSKIIYPLARRLAKELNLDEHQVKIRDQESVMWTMHHLAFADITLCGYSSFCLIAGMASKYSVHSIVPTHSSELQNLAESMKFIPKYIAEFRVDTDIRYLSMGTVTEKNWNEDDILEYLLSH